MAPRRITQSACAAALSALSVFSVSAAQPQSLSQVCQSERAAADGADMDFYTGSKLNWGPGPGFPPPNPPRSSLSDSKLLEELIHVVRRWKRTATGPEVVRIFESPMLLREFAAYALEIGAGQTRAESPGDNTFLLPTSWTYAACLARAEAAIVERVAVPPPAARTVAPVTAPSVSPVTHPTSPRDMCQQKTTPGSAAYRECMVQIDVARYTRLNPPPPGPPSALEVAIRQRTTEEARTRTRKSHDPALEASQCIERMPRESSSLYGGLTNTCDFVVNVAFCTVGAPPGTSSEAFDCARSKGGLVAIPANQSSTLHTKDAARVEWAACQNPGFPMDQQWAPGQTGITHRCR